MDNPHSIISDEIQVNGSVTTGNSESMIVDHRTDMNQMDEIAAPNETLDGMQQNRDIVKEVAKINQQAKDKHVYKKTTNWHQQSADTQALGQGDQLGQIIQRLDRIEEKLDSLGKILK